MQKRVIALDTETTGFATNAAILSFYAVEFDMETGACGEELELDFNPGFPIEAKITEITGITDEMAKKHPMMTAEHIVKIVCFLKDSEVWIHNKSFDERIISHHLERFNQQPLQEIADLRCSMRLAKENNHTRAKLDDLCQHFGIDLSVRSKHGAKVDTMLLKDVVVKMKKGGYRGFDQASLPVSTTSYKAPPKQKRLQSGYPIEAQCPRCDGLFQKKGSWHLKCYSCWKAEN